jgi:excisionase family DNA binding protein
MTERLLTIHEVAERLNVPAQTIYGWNSRGTGPKYMKLGRHARWRLVDVIEWENAHAVEPAEQNGAPAA